MTSCSVFLLFPKGDDYSSIHEWPLFTALNEVSDCHLQAYSRKQDFIHIMHGCANDEDTRLILILGSDDEWSFLEKALAHHPQCTIGKATAPYGFYARMNARVHIAGISPTEEAMLHLAKEATNYCKTLAPRSLNTLSNSVGTVLKKEGLTIASAESCTGGLISKTLTDIAGSSAYVKGGICTYTPLTKQQLLGVPASTITSHGVVSQETAHAMAIGVQSLFAADLALSTTGVAGPGNDSEDNPEGLVYIGIAVKDTVQVVQFHATDETLFIDREYIRQRTVAVALQQLLKQL